jgi:hypothetical protein
METAYSTCHYCGSCECDEDCYPPEGYIRPGCEAMLYVNCYSVTRHFGGREEGGWYFNFYEPLASIPVKAISVEGCKDHCYNCSRAREGVIHIETGEKYELCKWGFHLQALDQDKVEEFKSYLEELYMDRKNGDIYSVLGGEDIVVLIENHPAETYPQNKPRYE